MKKRANLWIHEQMPESEAIALRSARQLAYFSAPFHDFEGPNQDAMAAVHRKSGGLVLLLADGAGGMPDGDKASAFVIDSLSKYSLKSSEPLVDEIFKCQQTILSWKREAGTTLTAAEISGEKMRVYHCGDSELLLLDAKGRVKYKTTSHSPTGYLQAAGRLSSREALSHPDRPFISNYLGGENFFLQMSPWLEFRLSDWILVGSDGLFDNLSIDQIRRNVKTAKSPLALVTALSKKALVQMERAHHREAGFGKADDLSLMVLGRNREKTLRLVHSK